MRSELDEIRGHQAEDRVMMNDINSKLDRVINSQTSIVSSLNGVRSRLPSTDLGAGLEHMKGTVDKLSMNMASLYKQFVDMKQSMSKYCEVDSSVLHQATHNDQRKSSNVRQSAKEAEKGVEGDASRVNDSLHNSNMPPNSGEVHSAPLSYSAVLQRPSTKRSDKINRQGPPSHGRTSRPGPSVECSDRSSSSGEDRSAEDHSRGGKTSSSVNRASRDTDGFVAVRRRRKNTYYLGHINPSVTYGEVLSFFEAKKLEATNIRMFYGRYWASVRFNIPSEQDAIVEEEGFWPSGMVFRRWKSKSAWDYDKESVEYSRSRYGNMRSSTNTKAESRFDASRFDRYDTDASRRDSYHHDAYRSDRVYDRTRPSYREPASQNRWDYDSRYDEWNRDTDSWLTSRP